MVRITNYNVAVARLIFAILFFPLGVAVLIHSFTKQGRAEVTSVLLSIGFIVASPLFLLTLTFWVEFGDEVVVRGLRGPRRIPWDEVADVRVGLVSGRYRFVRVELKSGRHFQLKVNPAEEESLRTFLAGRGMRAHEADKLDDV